MEKLINDFSFGLFFWQIILFIVLLLVLRRYAWKPILNAVNDREEGIKNALAEADKARQEMQNINADNIDATIIMAGPQFESPMIYEHVPLFRTSDYNAKIEVDNSGKLKTELLNNLVVMYEVEAGELPDQQLNHLMQQLQTQDYQTLI